MWDEGLELGREVWEGLELGISSRWVELRLRLGNRLRAAQG